MRAVLVLLAAQLAAAAPPAGAQTLAAQPRLYDPAPWWMREPVIASPGSVFAELRANRASFSAGFETVDAQVAEATRKAGEQVRDLARALRAFGPEAVRVETTFSTRPLYAQYRDKDGQLQTNAREDRIERYAVSANVSIEVRDLSNAEQVYGLVAAARPSSIAPVYFRLEPSNAVNDALFAEAVRDAARRARAAAADAGARLGAVKLIDPTGRACQQDVLVAGAPRSFGFPGSGTDVSEVMVTGSRVSDAAPLALPPAPAPPPPPPPPPAAEARSPNGAAGLPRPVELPLQPPLQRISREACVVYALAPG